MQARCVSALGRLPAAVVVSALIAIAVHPRSYAQQPPTKGQSKPNEQTKGKSEQKPTTPAQQPQQGGEPQLVYSAWTKVCQKGPEATAKRVCFIGRDGRVESGMPIVAAVLIEPDGEPRKLLRVTLPLGMSLAPGTRVIVDDGQPMTAPYVICVPNGCVADYEASGELIAKMKSGQRIHVQGINGSGQPVSLQLPLADFAKSYDGPATDPKALEPPKPQ
jgi:invasion protein IalB